LKPEKSSNAELLREVLEGIGAEVICIDPTFDDTVLPDNYADDKHGGLLRAIDIIHAIARKRGVKL
jgi:hypothetical protein